MTHSPEIAAYKPADTAMRFADFVLALSLLTLTALPMVVIAILIKLEDRGPVVFWQPRVGKNRRGFAIAKFRTMTHDPFRAIGAAAGPVSAADRETFQTTSPGDSRITRVGRILRPLHLDELPQILNILKGEMSLVGVRPDVPVQEVEYTPQQWVDRHVLRPGITGLAQIDGAIDSMAARTAQDLVWVQTRNFGLYLKILWGTAIKVLKRNSL
jgi:lipopolysaccharide/colanic/teichoic acid biosynthesis glycosyltransferase